MHSDTTTKAANLNCTICGKSFTVPACRTLRARYCSQECYHLSKRGKRRKPLATLACEECGKCFEVKRKVINRALRDGHRARPFCGRMCYAAALKKRPEIKFWRKVTKTGGRWLWGGSGLPSGYGIMAIGAKRKQLAHRFSYELHHGAIPEGLNVLHRCDNPPCVRAECNVPDCKHLKDSKGCESHLFLGTDADNNADMCEKNRDASGSRHPNAKLTEAQVDEIRQRYLPRIVTFTALAKEFHVSQITVIRIVKGQRWRRYLNLR